jgi:hypothetical protein
MDATALRARTQAATGATAASTTNGPSSSTATTGGGPIAAPIQPVLLGERLLPAPIGQPQTIHLNDGSMLVPVARVDASGARTPLTGGPGSAPLNYAVNAAAAAPTAATPAAPAAVPATTVAGGSEPLGFLYRGDYYKKFKDSTVIDITNAEQVQDKVTRGTLDHVKNDEPDWQGFGVTKITTRAVDPNADRDLLNVDPNAAIYVEVHGIAGTGEAKMIPSVVERDGDVFVDPRLSKG